MPKYLAQFTYTAEAWKTMTQNPQDRTQTVRALAEQLGGKLEALYYTFGEYDGFVIIDMPDSQSATAFVLAANAPGHLKQTKTTILLTPQELLEAENKAKGISYQGPRSS